MDADTTAAVAATLKYANQIITIIKAVAPGLAILALVFIAIGRLFGGEDGMKRMGAAIGGVFVALAIVFLAALYVKSVVAGLPAGPAVPATTTAATGLVMLGGFLMNATGIFMP